MKQSIKIAFATFWDTSESTGIITILAAGAAQAPVPLRPNSCSRLLQESAGQNNVTLSRPSPHDFLKSFSLSPLARRIDL